MQQHLEVKALLALVPHIQHRLQTVSLQRDTVHQSELVRPRLLRLVAELRVAESEVERDRVVAAFR